MAGSQPGSTTPSSCQTPSLSYKPSGSRCLQYFELAGRTIEALHDLERFANRLAQVIESFDTVAAAPAAQR